jgi:tetratricopeptide (TPR) repeat protein
MSDGYSVRDVQRILGLSRGIIFGFVRSGLVSPTRGERRAQRFSFQDLIILRTARELCSAKVPSTRIMRSLKCLRQQLPESLPLSGLRITAVGDRVAVREGPAVWQADTGQYLLDFGVAAISGALTFVASKAEESPPAGDAWFSRGCDLEPDTPEQAIEAYKHAIADDPLYIDAYTNLGRLHHAAGRLDEAEKVYRRGLEAGGEDPLLWFNLGVLLTELERNQEAIAAYTAALRMDADFADCHFNLAQLCEAVGRSREALRHYAAYRKLQP